MVVVSMLLFALLPWATRAQAQSQTPQPAAGVAPTLENRCGWFHNPTPNNATLTDRDGEWVVSTQGGDSAEGDWPVFTDAQWKKTNGHYGYGCACMKVVVDRGDQRVLRIASATAKPLKACREDRALPKP
ncbi:MAG: DUF4087 domain-containing protein [Gammaproteobacteria bacterium]|jgi:hypothetical protein|nr:DUF4087 domain-containing protein [Gammaproteobacteria bacterium]MBU0826877.1 DUF4087 domain-containing protein [Gammaproteobacteria bacterium]MBU0892045.1 DUF4087 domain-containing protein [Gammaproteobacteria bacterium]MBU1815769.1 DUF4087 domain-containing protein [Gammaproteobacteria bacterium]